MTLGAKDTPMKNLQFSTEIAVYLVNGTTKRQYRPILGIKRQYAVIGRGSRRVPSHDLFFCGCVTDFQRGRYVLECERGLLRTKVYSAFLPCGVGKCVLSPT